MADSERLVRVNWDGTLTVDEAVRLRNDVVDCGLYQVYGFHEVFGPEALLYIGRTDNQTFALRIAQHRPWLRHVMDCRIRIGRLRDDDYKLEPPNWHDWLGLQQSVEGLTIYWHSPPYNSQGIVRYAGLNVRVQNLGNRGRLLPEYSARFGELARPAEAK